MQDTKFIKSIFIFRRDLRLYDNSALLSALSLSKQVIPIFIFDPRQVKKNTFKSNNALQFMLSSLKDLEKQLQKCRAKLHYFYGKAEDVLEDVIKSTNAQALFVNYDYTPFSLKRDNQLKKVCHRNSIKFFTEHDALLHAPGQVVKNDGKPYTVYSAFYKKGIKLDVSKPRPVFSQNFFTDKISSALNKQPDLLEKKNSKILLKGGRAEALSILQNIKSYEDYDELRNFPTKSATTNLSAHNKFGTCSVREVYHAIERKLGREHSLIKELYWRDFFSSIGFFFPHVYGKSFHSKYAAIPWKNNKSKFQKWCQGNTGFPIVDAGMRELNTTGFMHNRVRMIVASFLVKDLHISWTWGEKYFAQQLIDYDPAVNNGNWQWAASTGCDAQPYFRIFNPWLQQKKFDLDAEYIKKWVPELTNYSPKQIHSEEFLKENTIKNYSKPMLNHKEAKLIAMDLYDLS